MKHLLDPPFSTYAQSSEKKQFLSSGTHTRICANHEVRNVGFLENCARIKWMIAYALNR